MACMTPYLDATPVEPIVNRAFDAEDPFEAKTVTDKQSNIVVGVTGSRVFIRVQGKGNCQVSQPLCQFSSEIIKRGFHEFVVDLADCSSMDSTFLGVLAGIGLRLMSASGHIHLVNLNPRCREVVVSLGIDRLSTVEMRDPDMAVAGNGGETEDPAALQPLVAVQAKPADAEARARCAELMIDAHNTLMQIDPQNVPKFKDCVRFLAEDLEKLRAAQKNPPS